MIFDPDTIQFNNVFNSDTICIDGDLIYQRIYAALYPNIKFVEDARPDYYILRTQFDDIIQEVYGTLGISIYKSYISGKCLDIRVIPEHKTVFFVMLLIGEEIADRNYRLSNKDLDFVNEMGQINDLQDKLDRISAQDYNCRELSPFVIDSELIHSILRVFYYPIEEAELANLFCTKYNDLKFDRNASKSVADNAIYTLGQNNQGLVLNKHFLNTSKYKIDIIDSNYNDGFQSVYDKIITFLKSDENGLVLLTGEPGTGKSSLLMHLTSVCKDLHTQFVFIPAAFAGILSDPTFLPFAVTNLNDSVLILEDAEDILKDRSTGNGSAVSNILNVTDGILGKIVKVKLIATVNKTSVIDFAIIRKGRLKVQYAFEKLSVEKSNKLYEKLGKSLITDKPLTLAEIYNSETESITTPYHPKRIIGFNRDHDD